MVPVWYLYVGLASCCALAGIATYLMLRVLSRKAVEGLARKNAPIPAPLPNTLVEADVMRGFSERLSVLEGRLPALQQMLDGYAGLSVRISEMEARLPTVADAFERFGTLVQNAEKRRRSSESNEKNKQLTVEEVAAQAGLAASGAGPASQFNASRAGVLGSGGNGQRSG